MDRTMPKSAKAAAVKEGDSCAVIAGIHAGKSGTAADFNTSKTGHLTLTVVQSNGQRFKTLAKNVVVRKAGKGG